jgi:catechol 2,3-dioxygenase-like lactoylglutathione lyase family enzyme
MSLNRIDHFAIEVKDIDAYVRTLEQTGGLKLIRWGVRMSNGRRIAMLGDGVGMKIEVAEEPSASTPRLDHVAFRSVDVEGDCQALDQAGWTVQVKPRRVPAAHATSAMLSSADGFKLQVIGYDPTSPDIIEWTERSDDTV